MPINPDLLIAAPMLQDSFVDKDGTPMAGGTISCFHDNSRSFLKNWYYQTGTIGNYSYVPLPNPLTLSAAGTIEDINGIDTIPFFYPYDENDESIRDPYYIVIENASETNQITRENFPFLPSVTGSTAVNSFNNLIVNNGFWRNIAPNLVNTTPFQSFTLGVDNVVAPSQHDGFRFPDVLFLKSASSAVDTVSFLPFLFGNQQPIEGYIVPEYYLNHICSSNPGLGETHRYYSFPIALHINTLANVTFTVSIQAQNAGGTGIGQNIVSLLIFQDTGSGTTPPMPIQVGQITVDSTWTTYTFTSEFPATSGLTISQGGDDALYLLVELPINTVFAINFTKPSIFLTDGVIPNNDFQTYDQVDAIINSPRTGDIRTSINTFYPYGWVPMNDGTIGNQLSNATTRSSWDTWPLFNLIWNACAPYSASGSGTTNPLCQMYNSSGAQVGYGPNLTIPTTAYQDFINNNALSLTRSMGNVILGTVPLSALLPATPSIIGYSSEVTAFDTAGNLTFGTVASNLLNLFVGAPVTFKNVGGTLPGNINANEIYYAIPISSTTFFVSNSFANAVADVPIAFLNAGTGTTTVNYAGAAFNTGEYDHLQLLNEIPDHTHNPAAPVGNGFMQNATPSVNILSTATSNVSMALATTTGGVTGYGTQEPFNIVQPGTFNNVFIKL